MIGKDHSKILQVSLFNLNELNFPSAVIKIFVQRLKRRGNNQIGRSVFLQFNSTLLLRNGSRDNRKFRELLDFGRPGPHRSHPLQTRRWTTATRRTTSTTARTPTTNDRHDAEEEEEKRDECSVKPTDRLFGTRPISSFGAFAPWTRTRGRPLSSISNARPTGWNETSGNPAKNPAPHRFFFFQIDDRPERISRALQIRRNEIEEKMFREIVQDCSW